MAIRIGPMIPQMPKVDLSAAKTQEATPASTVKEFGQYLAEALANVEAAQTEAAAAAQRLATGEIQDVAEVTIASEKATLALQLTVQVRNKVLEAYQEMMRMPV
ncbi:MAG TPA: flagellar hook-basal body complex protein FliE [Symbiobacteriaceae bacterium]|nr:flagellar hook-basal body complex protein FliE [Symbiobacteriaceae bacterium]